VKDKKDPPVQKLPQVPSKNPKKEEPEIKIKDNPKKEPEKKKVYLFKNLLQYHQKTLNLLKKLITGIVI